MHDNSPARFHFSSGEMEVVNAAPPPPVQKLPGFRFFSSGGNSGNPASPSKAAAQPPPPPPAQPARQPNGILKNNYEKEAMNRVGQR